MSVLAESCGGAYDHLYRSLGRLWPATPGRMVVRAAESSDSPGRALDLGCGDGKNMAFLEQHGWTVDGVDVSQTACAEAARRRAESDFEWHGDIVSGDAGFHRVKFGVYELVVMYGLLHCLDDERVRLVERRAWDGLSDRGLVALASFDDRLPLPEEHGTTGITLRSSSEILSAFPVCRWQRCIVERGHIEEAHEPVIGHHRHSLTWALLRKK
jgi:SAM-dependent methyltransferase